MYVYIYICNCFQVEIITRSLQCIYILYICIYVCVCVCFSSRLTTRWALIYPKFVSVPEICRYLAEWYVWVECYVTEASQLRRQNHTKVGEGLGKIL